MRVDDFSVGQRDYFLGNFDDRTYPDYGPGILGNISDASSGAGADFNSDGTGGESENAAKSSIWDDMLDAGEKVWTSPNTALGLAIGAAGIPFGGSMPHIEHGAIVFNNYPWQVHGGGSVTLGNTIVSNEPQLTPRPIRTYSAQDALMHGQPLPPNPVVDEGFHEEGHVHQASALGPFFLPVYGLQSLFSDGPSPMEKAADTYGQTGKGWWPW